MNPSNCFYLPDIFACIASFLLGAFTLASILAVDLLHSFYKSQRDDTWLRNKWQGEKEKYLPSRIVYFKRRKK